MTSPSRQTAARSPSHPRIFHAVDGLVRAARMDELTEDRETRGMVKHFYSEERREAAKQLQRSKNRDHRDRNTEAHERFRQQNEKLQEKLREFAEARINNLDTRVHAASAMKTERNAASRSGLVYRRLLTSMRSAEAKRLLQTLQDATLEKLRDDCVRDALQSGGSSAGLHSPEEVTVAKLLRHQKALFEKRVAKGLPPPQVVAVTPTPLSSGPPAGALHDASGGRRTSPRIGAGSASFDASGSGPWSPTTDASVRNRTRAMEQNAMLSMPSRSWESPKNHQAARGSSALVAPGDVPNTSSRPVSRVSQKPVRAATPAAAEHAKKMSSQKQNFVAWAISDAKRKRLGTQPKRAPSPLISGAQSSIVGPRLL